MLRLAQHAHERRETVVLARRVDAAFGRALLALFGNDAGGMRRCAQRDREHFVRRRHFEIERQIDLARQPIDVVVGDMPAILAQMRRDAVRAGRQPPASPRAPDRDSAPPRALRIVAT